MPRAETQSPPSRRRGRIVADWNVEAIGENTILVVRRHRGRGPQRNLARHDKGRIIWFGSLEEAQAHAERWNPPHSTPEDKQRPPDSLRSPAMRESDG